MKKVLRGVMVFMLSISVLLTLSSCHMKESYKKFNIKNITENITDEYFTSDVFSFAKVQNVVIIPEVKAINHNEYVVYVSAYSKSGEETVSVKKVTFKEETSVLESNEPDGKIEFKENEQLLYEGWVKVGPFREEKLKMADGKIYNLIIEIDVESNDSVVSKEMIFEVEVKGYKSWVFQT